MALATGLIRMLDTDVDFRGLHLYTASGDPVRTLAPPEGITSWAPFAYDGARLAIGVERNKQPGSIVLLDTTGRELGRFTQPEWICPVQRAIVHIAI